MNITALLVALVLCAATLPLMRAARRTGPGPWRRAVPLLWLVLGAAAGVAAGREGRAPWKLRTAAERPLVQPSDGYVSSDTCRACHPSEYDSWYDTYHRTMTQVAVEGAVLAPFDGRTLQDAGFAEREPCVPFRRGDEFWVELVDPYHEGSGPAPRVERRVVQLTGSHHQQLYWFATGKTRALGLFPYGFRIDEQRWMPVDAMFLTPPRGEQSKVLGRWNSSCIRCHATHGKPRFQGAANMETEVSELGIACEMCHGPAREHVEANQNPLRRYRLHAAQDANEDDDPTMIDPRELSPQRSTEVCGQCHGVTHLLTTESRREWVEQGFTYRPGDDLMATRGLGEPDADKADRKFWADGQLRVTGREHTALLRTPCYQSETLSCLACHQMHQAPDDPRPRAEWRDCLLAPGMDGDKACTQCHADFATPAALTAHTHHAPESSGSRCLDCHMPHTTYGLMGGIRSHDVEAPTVQKSLETGRPNACNQCHLDRSLGWTARWLAEWYGTPEPELDAQQRELSAAVLWTIQGDAGQRALMAWSLGWDEARAASGSDWMLPYLALLMNDPYHTVRFIAGRSARAVLGGEELAYDHLASEEQRIAATTLLLERWSASRPPGEAPRPALLLGPGGVWDENEAGRLLEGRDNSDVVLQE